MATFLEPTFDEELANPQKRKTMTASPAHSNTRWISSGLAAAAASLVLCAGGAKADVVFQADFNGSDGGTGGPTDIVTMGGTATIAAVAPGGASSNINNPGVNGTNQITSSTPWGGGSYFNSQVNNPGTLNTFQEPVTVTFTSAANSFASLQSTDVNGHTALNGGFDLFVRANSVPTVDCTWFRPIDISNQSGTAGLRLILGSSPNGDIQFDLHSGTGALSNFTLISGTGGGGGFAYGSGQGALISSGNFHPNSFSTEHIAFTFRTDANGLITAELFGVEGTGAIDATATPLISETFNLDATVVGSTVFGSGAWGTLGGTAIPGSSFDASYDTVRIYSGTTPTSFDALAAVPEQSITTYTLAAAGLLGLIQLRRRRRHVMSMSATS